MGNQTLSVHQRGRLIIRYFLFGICGLALILGAVLIGAASWIRRTFGPITVDQLLMHMPGAGGEATTGAESSYISSFLIEAIMLPLLILAFLLIGIGAAWTLWSNRDVATIAKDSQVRFGSQQRGWASRKRFISWGAGVSAAAVFIAGAGVFAQAISASQYVHSFFARLTIDEFYAEPDRNSETMLVLDERAENERLNLVTIFLESGEKAFGDDSLFEINMYEPLERATNGWLEFDSLTAYQGGGWTMAGIVGSECGIPLRGAGIGEIPGGEIGDGTSEYLGGLSCLGDVLSDDGYTGVFMGGADESFASKGNYLRSHGYQSVYDLNYWEAQGETQRSHWGLSDRRLMALAQEEVTRLHEAEHPFFLSLLTVDAHEPATLFDECPLQTEEELESVIYCSMTAVAEFVQYLEMMGYLENTVVLIVGDHPKQFGEVGIFMEELETLNERPLFNRFWVPRPEVQLSRTEIDQLSIAATTLDILGLGREDGRFGLGFSALRPVGSESGAVYLPNADYDELLNSRSTEFYARAWGLEPLILATAADHIQ